MYGVINNRNILLDILKGLLTNFVLLVQLPNTNGGHYRYACKVKLYSCF